METLDALVARFEAGTLEGKEFHHLDHVRVAWRLLALHPAADAIGRFSRGLQAIAEAAGRPELYHETITWAYLLIIRERMERQRATQSWDEFAKRNPDLFAWPIGALQSFYRVETLQSDLARRCFVFPDRSIEKEKP